MGSTRLNSETTEVRKLTAHDFVWYDPGWDPYCLMCSTMGRMSRTSFGWKCEGRGDHFGRIGCGNTIGFDLTHYPPNPPAHTWRFSDPAFTQSFA